LANWRQLAKKPPIGIIGSNCGPGEFIIDHGVRKAASSQQAKWVLLGGAFVCRTG
jgi:hypothetical protein